MSAVHTLVITADIEDPNDSDLFAYEIQCPGVTDACRMWVECDVSGCGSTDAERDHNIVLHEQRHQLFPVSGTWCVPTDTCYLTVADDTPDAAAWLAGRNDLSAGEHEVGHDFDEGSVADLHLVNSEAAAR